MQNLQIRLESEGQILVSKSVFESFLTKYYLLKFYRKERLYFDRQKKWVKQLTRTQVGFFFCFWVNFFTSSKLYHLSHGETGPWLTEHK